MASSVKSASLAILFVMTALFSGAQALGDDYLQQPIAPAQVDQQVWKQATEDRNYFEKANKQKEAEKPDLPEIDKPEIYLSWIKYLAILAALAFVTWIIVKLLSSKSNVKIKQTKLSVEHVDLLDDDLQEADLEKLLQQALEEKAYRLALRIQYLITLRDMEQVQWIDYRKDKTNTDYVREMQANSELKNFTLLTHFFDFVWYGDFPFGEAEYRQVNERFENYIHIVRSHGS